MKPSELDPNKLVVSVKMYYQGCQWETYRYVDTNFHNIEGIHNELMSDVSRLSKGCYGVLSREDVAKKLLGSSTDSE